MKLHTNTAVFGGEEEGWGGLGGEGFIMYEFFFMNSYINNWFEFILTSL